MAGKSARKLKNEHRAFIVQRVACYDSPKEVAEAVKEEYGIEISPQAVESYDPNKRAGRTMAKSWRELFDTTRKAFLENVSTHVPEANKAVRIRMLANSARALKARGNHLGAAEMLERIAKELGNVHTNRRELTGADGKAIAMDVEYKDLSIEQIDAQLLRLTQAAAADLDQVTGNADKPPAATKH